MKKKLRNNKKKSAFNLVPVLKSMLLGVVFLAILGISYGMFKVFSIKTVECKLQTDEQCPLELEDALSSLIGKSMFFTNYEKVLQDSQILSQPYSLSSVSKSLPNKLSLIYTAEEPLVLLKQADSVHVISRSGKAFPQIDESNPAFTQIVQLSTDQELVVENKMDEDTLRTIQTLIDTIEELSLPIDQLTWLDKSTIQLSMIDRPEIAVIDSESPRLELQKLSLILQSKEYQALSEPKQELDLRFTMPVLRTSP